MEEGDDIMLTCRVVGGKQNEYQLFKVLVFFYKWKTKESQINRIILYTNTTQFTLYLISFEYLNYVMIVNCLSATFSSSITEANHSNS